MKLLNNGDANNEGSRKFTHTTILKNFPVFMDTPGYYYVWFLG